MSAFRASFICLLCMISFPSIVYSQTNLPPNNVVSNTSYYELENFITVNPNNSHNLFSTWYHYLSGSLLGYGFSTDGGSTWSTSLLNDLPQGFTNGFDPVCAFDELGNAYYVYCVKPAAKVRNATDELIKISFGL